MKIKILRVSKDLLCDLLKADGSVRIKGMPADARIVEASTHLFFDQDCIALKIESEEFKDVLPGCHVEELYLQANSFGYLKVLSNEMYKAYEEGKGWTHIGDFLQDMLAKYNETDGVRWLRFKASMEGSSCLSRPVEKVDVKECTCKSLLNGHEDGCPLKV